MHSELFEPLAALRIRKPVQPARVALLAFKLACDIAFCLAAAPFLLLLALILLCLNPFLNPGPLLFIQDRMGKNGACFRLWKFRTMVPARKMQRAHNAPLESHRINSFGQFLRKSRIDELPNLINILRGEMSLVGPRPDAWEHAVVLVKTIGRYPGRFRARPGITGLAQIRNGYADCDRLIVRKARLDCIYIDRGCLRLELHIILQTVKIVLTGFGAK